MSALKAEGFDVGSFAAQVIKDVEDGKGADHSARPDIANEQSQNKITDPAGLVCGETNPFSTAMKVQMNSVDSFTLANSIHHYLFRAEGKVWGIAKDAHNAEHILPILETLYKSETSQSENRINLALFLKLLTTVIRPRKIWHYTRRALAISERFGFQYTLNVISNWLHKSNVTTGDSNVPTLIQIKRDFSNQTHLIVEGFHNYNIVQVKRTFYGIKQGFPFDKEKADKHGFPYGCCFTGINVRQVEKQILSYIDSETLVVSSR